MAKRQEDAPDCTTAPAPQDRQAARMRSLPTAAREWLGARQRAWSRQYLEEFWIDAQTSPPFVDYTN